MEPKPLKPGDDDGTIFFPLKSDLNSNDDDDEGTRISGDESDDRRVIKLIHPAPMMRPNVVIGRTTWKIVVLFQFVVRGGDRELRRSCRIWTGVDGDDLNFDDVGSMGILSICIISDEY
mmetsp:Transcript_19951/g.43381  ORF Transcript_19951/g.43381 Transcript_19951/m.43381 type:complete len:119 (-) Transcript_19951:63-419(-)